MGKRPHCWTWARRATALGFLALLVLGASQAFPWFKGSTTATSLMDTLPFTDPLAALEVTLSSQALEPTLLWGALWLVLLALVLGPVFCGWLCPLGLLLDLNQSLRSLLAKGCQSVGLRLPALGLPGWLPFLFLGFVLAFSLVGGIPAFQTVSPINFLSWLAIFRPLGEEGFQWMVLIPLSILGVELFAPRLWCRAFCPLGGLYRLLGRFAFFQIRVDRHKECLKPCGVCTSTCPMAIRVLEDYVEPPGQGMADGDCTRCGQCVDRCPRKKLHLGFREKKKNTGR